MHGKSSESALAQVVLYLSEPAPDNVTVSASVKLPEGRKHAHVQKVDLTPASKVPHFLNIASRAVHVRRCGGCAQSDRTQRLEGILHNAADGLEPA